MAIHVRVRLFAIQRQLAGTRLVELDLPDGATVEDGWQALVERFPVLAPGRPSVRFAVDGEYADPDAPLHDGAELASIPPVSGGAPPEPRRILELRDGPLPATILDDLTAALATDADGGVVGFVGRTRVTPGTPAP
ncbi:MAG TPA: MoaD/ThiS family protein, partial [Candidatus Limnocylindrales bacterium]|nr:MoaD/ThiS family protein [Candidatus Limnocylindrales bacterium]